MTPDTIAKIKARVDVYGAERCAEECGMASATLLRGLAGLPVRRASQFVLAEYAGKI